MKEFPRTVRREALKAETSEETEFLTTRDGRVAVSKTLISLL